MRRNIIQFVLLAALLALTWMQSPRPARVRGFEVSIEPQALPATDVLARSLGPFRLDGAWVLSSPSGRFGGYSALLPMGKGQLLAFSDGGKWMRFSPPGAPPGPLTDGGLLRERGASKESRDVESATRDPATGRIWLGIEGSNSVARLSPRLKTEGLVDPPAIRGWGINTGPEAMTRLSDGRFVLLRETFKGWFQEVRHDAVLFAGDPVEAPASGVHFSVDGPDHFMATDMAQLPDGRLLVLFRRLIWPMPQRFAGRIAIGDPAKIEAGKPWRLTEVARLSSSLPIDNFEGLAIRPGPGRRVSVWLISDDNISNFQRTLLWKLSVDPADLPY